MSEISYEQKYREQEAAERKAALEAKNRAVYEICLNKFLLRDTEANYRLLLAWSPVLTIDAVEYLMNPKTCPPNFQPDMTTKDALVAELIEILRDPRERRMSAHDLHTRERQLQNASLADLRAYKRRLTFQQEHPTAESARAYLKEQRQQAKPKYIGYDNIPPMITLPGETIARTAKAALLHLSKTDYWTFKNRYVPRYGMQQITDILNQQ